MSENTALSKNDAAALPRLNAPVDVFENEEHYLVRADVPGVDKEHIDIRFHDGELRLEATRHDGERGVVYRRSLGFGDDVDPDAIEASLDEGVLSLTLGKAATRKPRRIAIA